MKNALVALVLFSIVAPPHWCHWDSGQHSQQWWKKCRGATELPR